MKLLSLKYTKKTPMQDAVEVEAHVNPQHIVSLTSSAAFSPGQGKPYVVRIHLKLLGEEDRWTLNEYTEADAKLEMGRIHKMMGTRMTPEVLKQLEQLDEQGPCYLAARRLASLQTAWLDALNS